MSAVTDASLPRRVAITGASRGIGRAIALALIERGVRLAFVGRDRAALEALRAGRDEHALVVADLAEVSRAEPSIEEAARALGGLDGFVSCAGVVEYAEVGAITRAALERQLAVNLTSPALMAQRAASHLAAAGGGAMLFVTSTLGVDASTELTAAYAASKAGLTALARSFALELAPRGVRVNALAPGVIDTDMVRVPRRAGGEAATTAQLEALRRLHPLGRLGTPADVAETALFLLSASYVTGSVVRVDGGLTLGSGAP